MLEDAALGGARAEAVEVRTRPCRLASRPRERAPGLCVGGSDGSGAGLRQISEELLRLKMAGGRLSPGCYNHHARALAAPGGGEGEGAPAAALGAVKSWLEVMREAQAAPDQHTHVAGADAPPPPPSPY